jgi:hypothetical protein
MEPRPRTTEQPSTGEQQASLSRLCSFIQPLRWHYALQLAANVGEFTVMAAVLRKINLSITNLSTVIVLRASQCLRLSLTRDTIHQVVSYLQYYLVVWLYPKFIISWSRYNVSSRLRDLVRTLNQLYIPSMGRYLKELIKNAVFKGVFFYRKPGLAPSETYVYSNLPCHDRSIRLLEYRKVAVFPLLERHVPEFSLEVYPLDEAPCL